MHDSLAQREEEAQCLLFPLPNDSSSYLRIEERELEAGVAYKATSEEAAASEPTES